MQLPAIILSVVILLSVFLTHGAAFNKPQELNNQNNNQSSFISDLSMGLGRKLLSLKNLGRDNVIIVGDKLQENSAAAALKTKTVADSIKKNVASGAEKIADTGNKITNRVFALHQSLLGQLAENSLNSEKIFKSDNLSAVISDSNLGSGGSILPQSNLNCQLPDESSLTGMAQLVEYLKYNAIVFEKNPDKRWPIASLTKLMTAFVAREKINPDEKIIIREEAAANLSGKTLFKAGEIFYARDLIQAMLVGSSNNAAVALVGSVGEKDFIDAMQRLANDLRMYNTTYIEPTGLSFVNQSTASDLAKLIVYIYKNDPGILEITRQPEIKIQELKSKEYRIVSNVDLFAGFADFIGGKTGFIDEAGHNLVGLFNVNNEVVLTVVLGAANAFDETRTIKSFAEHCNPSNYWLIPQTNT